jgi:inhibitor of KinA
VKIVADGDAAIVVEFEERIDPAISTRCAAAARAIAAGHIPGVREIVPAYRAVTVYFDPLKIDSARLRAAIERVVERLPAEDTQEHRRVRIPVCYGGDFGPDLSAVASFAQMTEDDVVRLHSQASYRVMMLGFTPGFAYMGIVDSRIAAPRLPTPRQRVPRGSVGIAKEQTGVYPSETPGGWQIIGRTPLRPFDLSRSDPFLLRAGDDVEFVPITPAEFAAVASTR